MSGGSALRPSAEKQHDEANTYKKLASQDHPSSAGEMARTCVQCKDLPAVSTPARGKEGLGEAFLCGVKCATAYYFKLVDKVVPMVDTETGKMRLSKCSPKYRGMRRWLGKHKTYQPLEADTVRIWQSVIVWTKDVCKEPAEMSTDPSGVGLCRQCGSNPVVNAPVSAEKPYLDLVSEENAFFCSHGCASTFIDEANDEIVRMQHVETAHSRSLRASPTMRKATLWLAKHPDFRPVNELKMKVHRAAMQWELVRRRKERAERPPVAKRKGSTEALTSAKKRAPARRTRPPPAAAATHVPVEEAVEIVRSIRDVIAAVPTIQMAAAAADTR